jgi:hypothetical protein
MFCGSLTTISGAPPYSAILPETQTRLSSYFSSGAPNFSRFSPQISIVKTWFAYGLSRFKNVRLPRVVAAQRVIATFPQTVACSPMWTLALAAVNFLTCADEAMTPNGTSTRNDNTAVFTHILLKCSTICPLAYSRDDKRHVTLHYEKESPTQILEWVAARTCRKGISRSSHNTSAVKH